MKTIIATIVLLVAAAIAGNWYLNRGNYQAVPFWQVANEDNTAMINHSVWQGVLDDFLVTDDPSGVNLVDYEALVDEPELLNDYIEAMTSLDPREYNRAEQFAYWVNVYNALTLDVIVRNYPTTSIRKISALGPWDTDVATIAGQTVTLNDIEHRILRANWDEHRIHFAVNCASIGCPNVQPTAFTATNTEELLQTAAVEYLQHPRGLRASEDGLVLSSIFEWYKGDFGNTEQEVLATLSQYLSDEQRTKVTELSGKVSYDYDWGLNDVQ